MSKKAPQPLFMVSGTDDYRRRKFIRTMMAEQIQLGWQVQHIDGTDHASLEGLLGSSGVLFDGMVLCVIHHPEKLPEKLPIYYALYIPPNTEPLFFGGANQLLMLA